MDTVKKGGWGEEERGGEKEGRTRGGLGKGRKGERGRGGKGFQSGRGEEEEEEEEEVVNRTGGEEKGRGKHSRARGKSERRRPIDGGEAIIGFQKATHRISRARPI